MSTNWLNDLTDAAKAVNVGAASAVDPDATQVETMRAAAAVLQERGDASGAQALRDMAGKFVTYGRWASDRQRDFAQALMARAAAPVVASVPGTADKLMDAASRAHAAGSRDAAVLRDMAGKFARYGSWASDRQRDYALSLYNRWPAPVDAAFVASSPAPAPLPEATVAVPMLFALLQRIARVEAEGLVITKKNGEPTWWVKLGRGEKPVAVIQNGVAKLLLRRLDDEGRLNVTVALGRIEDDPAGTIAAHGKATGSCGCCGRELTDPESIERGIGPVCITQAGW
jgi:hypothetical protein